MIVELSDIQFLRQLNKNKPVKPPIYNIPDFIEKNRIMPPGTPFPGPVDLSLTPHVVEWLENMSPYSPIRHQAIMKAAQIAATFMIECIIGFWMKELPTACMYISATQGLLEKWATKRLEPLIDSIGMREKILEFAEVKFGRKSRRTGDKVFSKVFIGGFLEMASAQSPASQRSDSIRLLVRDEIDGAPTQLKTGEGNWLNTSEARTKFWGDRKKITDLSTPTTYELSNIYSEYKEGDCRHYFVPCPECGKMQTLYWLPEDGNHGLRADTKAGKIERVYYLCEFCHDAIFDISKMEMFGAGKWKPTKKSYSNTFRSYYINSLYSPARTVSWYDYYSEWMKAKDDPEKMRGFTNLYGGMPFKETGVRPKIEKVIELRGLYKSGEVPNEVLWITGGADVQRGKKEYEQMTDNDIDVLLSDLEKNGKNPWFMGLPRIEIEILGHSHGYRTYSIEYKVFYGHTDDPYSGAWEKMREWLEAADLFYERQDGSQIECGKILIDSGDGERTATVYGFCEPYPGIFPCKGDQVLKKNLDQKGDEVTRSMFLRYNKSKIGEAQTLINVSTNYYKKKIYQALTIQRVQGEEQRPGFPEFPGDYPDHYFKMLTNEEKHIDGSFHAGGRPVESLDCRVYALCAGDIVLDERVAMVRERLVKNGMTKEMAKQAFNHKAMIEEMKFQRWREMKKPNLKIVKKDE